MKGQEKILENAIAQCLKLGRDAIAQFVLEYDFAEETEMELVLDVRGVVPVTWPCMKTSTTTTTTTTATAAAAGMGVRIKCPHMGIPAGRSILRVDVPESSLREPGGTGAYRDLVGAHETLACIRSHPIAGNIALRQGTDDDASWHLVTTRTIVDQDELFWPTDASYLLSENPFGLSAVVDEGDEEEQEEEDVEE